MHLSSNRRERNLALYLQFMTPARKLTHNTKFEHFWMQKDMNFGNAMILRHFGPEKCQNQTQKDTNFGNAMILHHFGPEKRQNPTQKDTNFGNAIILHYLGPENCQNPTTKDMNFEKLHSLTPAKCQQIRKVFVFSEICTIIEMHSLTPSTLTNQSLWEHLVAHFFDCRPIVIHSDSSTLVQDAVLNCYKRPAHYHYQFSYFFRRPTSSCVVF